MLSRLSRLHRASAPTFGGRKVVRSYHATFSSGAGKVVKHVDTEHNNTNQTFEFTDENWEKAKKILDKYPEGYKRSALMPLLDLAQRQNNGWLPLAAMNKVALIVGVPPMHVYEVATFYTMYNRTPVGKYFVQICGTTPCQLQGSEEVIETVEKHLGIHCGETTPDGMFTLLEVECLGACVHAPMFQVNDDYYEDLTPETAVKVLTELAQGKQPKTNSYKGRVVAEPVSGKTTLLEPPLGPYAPYLEKLDNAEKEKQQQQQQKSS